MIANPNLVSQAFKANGAYYFVYDSKFKWSISKSYEGDYYLVYYPGNYTIQDIATLDPTVYIDEFVSYTTKEIKTREAVESFAELYQIIQSKLYNLDSILDQIINTAA